MQCRALVNANLVVPHYLRISMMKVSIGFSRETELLCGV